MRLAVLASLATLVAVSGCTTDDYMRIEGMTPGAGNALAANTVMQMVDPWQDGVQDTHLLVPASRGTAAASAADDAADAKQSQTMSNSSSN